MPDPTTPTALEKQGVSASSGPGSHASHQAQGLGPTGFDPSRDELLLHKVVFAISTASVPHVMPGYKLPGSTDSRSLHYYLGVGIDHFSHDYSRHERLLQGAARQAIVAVRDSDRSGEAVETTGSTEGESAAPTGDRPDLVSLQSEIARLREALVDHNDMLRSAQAIARRDGAMTNWKAFVSNAGYTLAQHHETANAARDALQEAAHGE